MNCYGKYSLVKNECRKCELVSYCKNAGDPPMLADGSLKATPLSEALDYAGNLAHSGNNAEKSDDKTLRQQTFSRHDMLELMSFLLALDLTTLDYLEKKIQIPTLKFSDLAGERQITRQAVHKYIRQKCECVPELAIMLKTRKQLNKQKKNSLLDEWFSICKRHNNQARKGKNHTSIFLPGNVTDLFDLSKFRVFKGSRMRKSPPRQAIRKNIQ